MHTIAKERTAAVLGMPVVVVAVVVVLGDMPCLLVSMALPVVAMMAALACFRRVFVGQGTAEVYDEASDERDLEEQSRPHLLSRTSPRALVAPPSSSPREKPHSISISIISTNMWKLKYCRGSEIPENEIDTSMVCLTCSRKCREDSLQNTLQDLFSRRLSPGLSRTSSLANT